MITDFKPKTYIIRSIKEYQITFFCDLCSNSYTTKLISISNELDALEVAKNEARIHFNNCKNCNSWVCDEHYNEFRMMCTNCAPRLCPNCGSKLEKKHQFCTKCGSAIQ